MDAIERCQASAQRLTGNSPTREDVEPTCKVLANSVKLTNKNIEDLQRALDYANPCDINHGD